jgi:hypothetical protein
VLGPKHKAIDIAHVLEEGLRNGTIDIEPPSRRSAWEPKGLFARILGIALPILLIALGLCAWGWILFGPIGEALLDWVSGRGTFEGSILGWIVLAALMFGLMWAATASLWYGVKAFWLWIRSLFKH